MSTEEQLLDTLDEILDELRATRKLQEQAPEVIYNVYIQGNSVNEDRLQTALDRNRLR